MTHNHFPTVTRLFTLCFILFSLIVYRPAQSQTIRYVLAGASGDGLSDSNPSGNLPAMLSSLSATGGTVLVGSGLYTPTSTTTRTVSFSIASGVQVYGGYNASFITRTLPGQPGSTTLSGNISNTALVTDNSFHVLRFLNANNTTRLDGVVIANGNASGSGVDSRGGGIYNDGGGSGNASRPVIANCFFVNNRAGVGGGLYNWGQGGNSSPTVINCVFTANFSTSTFFSPGGSGVYNDGRNSGRSNTTFINCTFAGNTIATSSGFPGLGQAMYTDGRTSGLASVTLTNCIVWDNGGGNALENNSNGSVVARYSLIESSETDYSTVSGTPATRTSDPLFVNAATSNFRLLGCSPAVNGGDPATLSTTVGLVDVGGETRLFNSSIIDLGAFEVQADPTPAISITTPPPASSTVCAGSSLTVSVAYSGTATGIQWFRGSTTLTGQTSATFVLTNIGSSDAGTYRAALTGACNSVTTSGFQLSLAQSTGFSSQPPASSVVCPGGAVTASVSATGTGPLRYQWFLNGSPLTGVTSATTSTLSLTGISAASEGSYVVVVTGACTSATSTAFSLRLRPTLIYVTPTGAGLRDGSTVSNALAGTALRGALTSACASSTLLLGNGLYRPTEGNSRTLSFVIPSGIQIYGGYEASFVTRTTNPSGTTLTGEINAAGLADNSLHVVRFQNVNSSTRLDGVMVTAGNANGSNPDFWGGGIYNSGQNGGNSRPTLTNCTFVGNIASSSGGALFNDGFAGNSSPTITNCVFTSNTTGSNGGAIANDGASNGVSSPTITNCVFTNNTATAFGGAISNNYASPVLTSCTFTSNSCPENGGAVYNTNSRFALTTSMFNGNAARFGGAVYLTDSQPGIADCTFTSNTATSSGGAIHTSGSSLTALRSTFFTNRSNANGGAVTNDGGTPSFLTCRFTDNTSGSSGGVFYSVRNPALVVINSVLNGNSAPFGGVFYNAGSSPTVVNCTLFGNTASSGGAAIYNATGNPTLTNCVVWNNGGQNAFVNNTGNTIVGYCLIDAGETNYTTTPNPPATLTGDPRFLDAPDADFRPSACSPLIDAGDPATTTATVGTTDLGVQPRVFNSVRVDIGAFEFQGSPGPAVSVVTQPVAGSTACVGQSVNVPVSVSGAVVGYQWFRNGTSLTAQTGATLSLTNVQPGDAGAYSLVVTGCQNSVTSTVFSLSLIESVSIVNQPAAASLVCSGALVVVSVSFTGPGTVQWFRNGTPLPGETTPMLSLSSVGVDDSGSYLAVVTSTCNVTMSTAFVLMINALPIASLSFGPSATLTCAQPSLTLIASGGTSFTFANAGGILGTPGSASTLLVNSPDTYSVTVETAAGCRSTTATTISSNTTAPSVIISPTSGTLTCTNASITLTASSLDSDFRWSTNAVTPSLVVSTSGTYSVTVTAANGCSAPSSPVVVTQDLSELTAVSLSASSLTLICGGPPIKLTATPTRSADRYRFSGPGLSQNSPDNTARITREGSFSVTAIKGICEATATVALTGAIGLPVPFLAVSGPCANTGLTIMATTIAEIEGIHYFFEGPGLLSQNDGRERIIVGDYIIFRRPIPTVGTAVINRTGLYTVTVTAENGCTARTTLNITSLACPPGR